jgi:hypothetical protein
LDLIYLISWYLFIHLVPPKVTDISYDGVSYGELQKDFKIRCRVDSYSKPTIRMYQNNKPVKECTKMKGGSDKTHLKRCNIPLRDLKIGDNTTCVAENMYGKANESYKIPCFEGKDFCMKFMSQNALVLMSVY